MWLDNVSLNQIWGVFSSISVRMRALQQSAWLQWAFQHSKILLYFCTPSICLLCTPHPRHKLSQLFPFLVSQHQPWVTTSLLEVSFHPGLWSVIIQLRFNSKFGQYLWPNVLPMLINQRNVLRLWILSNGSHLEGSYTGIPKRKNKQMKCFLGIHP